MVSEDGDTAIAFNGEIYNHLEIRAELEGLGHRFPIATATRKRCCGHSFNGTRSAFRRMRGMFAVALWTESRRGGWCWRATAWGSSRSTTTRQGEDVYFGSELKAILEHPGVPRRLDLEALDTYLSVNYVPGPRTLIEGIRKMPPGHLLEWRHGKARLERWWKLPGGPPQKRSLEEAKEELDWLLRDAGSRAPGGGRSAGSVGVGGPGFLDHPALRGAALRGAAEDVFGFVRGAQLRREPVFPGGRAGLRHGPPRVRPEPGRGTARARSRISPTTRTSRARTRGRCRCGTCRA